MKVEIIFGVLGFGGSLDFNLRQTSSLIKFTRGFESRFTFASIYERCCHKRIQLHFFRMDGSSICNGIEDF